MCPKYVGIAGGQKNPQYRGTGDETADLGQEALEDGLLGLFAGETERWL